MPPQVDRSRLPLLLAGVLALFASATVGCARVPVYERGRLAHPPMTTSDLDHPSEEHVRAVQ